MQKIQLADAKNRLSAIARKAQLGEPISRIVPLPVASSQKAGLHLRVQSLMARPKPARMDIKAALEAGRK